MIAIQDILALHIASIEKFGGAHGIRDLGLLESAVARPFQTFGGEELYPHPTDKAAALCESLIVNHPFTDGNKRIGFIALAALLLEYGLKLTATQQEAYDTMISVSTGQLRFEGLVDWLKGHVVQVG
ncbi:MAG TPA: type II toxin-antitoxin system death-on-curing family toxin [Phnomibacter sp.]|nr:type II toxin-antitoxin system death-on-curing family toxin [Phnomibacter sp.]